MKKIPAGLMALLFFASSSFAQTEKGSWLVGGNVGLNTAKNDTKINFTPSGGYFIANNLAIGANVILNYSKNFDTKITSWGAGPFARFYMGTMNVRPFANADLSFQTNKTQSASTSNTYNSVVYFLGGGLAAFINRNVAIEGLAGYQHTAAQKQSGTGGFNLRIGFQVYLSHEQVERLRTP